MKMIKHERPQHALTKPENKMKLTCYSSKLNKMKSTSTYINCKECKTYILFEYLKYDEIHNFHLINNDIALLCNKIFISWSHDSNGPIRTKVTRLNNANLYS